MLGAFGTGTGAIGSSASAGAINIQRFGGLENDASTLLHRDTDDNNRHDAISSMRCVGSNDTACSLYRSGGVDSATGWIRRYIKAIALALTGR